ncbi:hypothetical protein [Paenochrobactrum sp. BZR 201-1]
MSDQSQPARGKGRKALLWTTVAIIVVAGAGVTGYKYNLQNNIRQQIEKRGGKAETVSADFFGNIHLKNVTLPLKNDQTINIATFDGRPQFLFLTGKADATGITTETAQFKITIPQLQIDDANFNKQVLSELFGGSSKLTPAERVERFSAKKIHVSEIQFEQNFLDTKQKTLYKNLTLNDVKNGQIASMQLEAAQVDMTVSVPKDDGSVNKEPMSVLIGTTDGKDIDAAFMTRFYTEKAGPANNELKPIQGTYSTKNISFKLPEATATINEIKSAGFSMRLPEVPFWQIMQDMGSVENIDDLSDDERRELFRNIIKIYEIMGKGDVELIDINITPIDETKPSATIANVTMNFDKQAFDMALKGLKIGTETDYFRMDGFTWDGFDYAATLEAGKKLIDVPTDEIDKFPFTTLMPTIGTFRLSGLDIDLPNTESDQMDEGETIDEEDLEGIEDTPDTAITPDEGNDQDDADEIIKPNSEDQAGNEEVTQQDDEDDGENVIEEMTDEPEVDTALSAAPTRVKFKMKNAIFSFLKPVNGIPTDIQIGYDGVNIPLQEIQDNFALKLRELGLDNVNISSNTHIVWDEPSESLLIKDISYKGENLGSFALSGVMGNMSREFFSGDKVMMQVAALGLKAKEINLRIHDEGMINKAFKLAALENGSTEEEARQLTTLMIAMFAAEFAGKNQQIQEVVETLNRFIANPNIFTLSIKSKNEKGIGAFEAFAATQNPLSLLEKVTIKATTE